MREVFTVACGSRLDIIAASIVEPWAAISRWLVISSETYIHCIQNILCKNNL